MSEISLSIITINLNNRIGLENTIKSVVNQKYRDFEFIVIDGSSNDGSVEVIKEYSHRINYWVSEPDTGLYNAMNKGVLKSSGEYLYFLNSGDSFFNEDALLSLFNYKPQIDIAICDILYKYNNKAISYPGEQKHNLLSLYNGFIHHQASIVRRECFIKFGMFDERFKIKGDYELYFRFVVKNNCSYKYFPVPLAYFDAYGISSNQSNNELNMKEIRMAHENNLPIYVVNYLDSQSKLLKPEYYFLIRILDRNRMVRVVLRAFFNTIMLIYKKLVK